MKSKSIDKCQILLTNDDGIRSPGLWAAAAALSEIGFVHVVAPREQYSGGGRSMPSTSDGLIGEQQVAVAGNVWTVYSVGGSPAQAVQHGVLEVLPVRPNLVVSGINYGENVGSGITISGTVGAAMEGASLGVPSLAVSLETTEEHHLSYSAEVNFSAAAYFTAFFARLLLERNLPEDVHLLKVDVPSKATLDTPWEMTRQSMHRYFEPLPPVRTSWDHPARVGYRRATDLDQDRPDTDAYAILVKQVVAVTPISLDLTSRVNLGDLSEFLRKEADRIGCGKQAG
jgi:5'-nucleotidase